MDFEIISNKFKSRVYAKKEDFYADVLLMFDNAQKFYYEERYPNPSANVSIYSLQALFTEL